jgi:DNA-binding SARP family transcriptional activator
MGAVPTKSSLDIQLFGGIRVLRNGKFAGAFPNRWSAGLLAYLAVKKDRFVHREILAVRFWPDADERTSRKALRSALWGVRSVLEPKGVKKGTYLSVGGGHVGLVDSPEMRIDVAEFDRLLGWCSEEERLNQDVAALESAVRLYSGDFMDGSDYEWCNAERERLLLAYLATLERLMELHMRRGELHLAIAHGEQVLQKDPLREHIHRQLMVCHCLQGDRPLAIRQYRRCEKILDDELDIKPMDATYRLYNDIESGIFRGSRSPVEVASTQQDRRAIARPPFNAVLPLV